MSTPENKDRQDAELWRRFSKAPGPIGARPDIDPNLLAAYLDGMVTPDEIELVERAMATDPELVETVNELRQLKDAAPAALSEPALARAKMALSAAASRADVHARKVAWWQRVAAAAAIVAMAFAGYRFGLGTSEVRASTDNELASAATFELQQERAEYDVLAQFDAADANAGGRK